MYIYIHPLKDNGHFIFAYITLYLKRLLFAMDLSFKAHCVHMQDPAAPSIWSKLLTLVSH